MACGGQGTHIPRRNFGVTMRHPPKMLSAGNFPRVTLLAPPPPSAMLKLALGPTDAAILERDAPSPTCVAAVDVARSPCPDGRGGAPQHPSDTTSMTVHVRSGHVLPAWRVVSYG